MLLFSLLVCILVECDLLTLTMGLIERQRNKHDPFES